MTYPDPGSGLGLPEMRALLERVDLGYLADRPGVAEEEVNWDEVLSLGEKQRLAMARLLFHKPRFAILDECTSAVSKDMESRLFHMCIAEEITYITISHRPALQMFHDRILSIGDGKCGFDIKKASGGKQPASPGANGALKKSASSKHIEESIQAFSDARSKRYEALAKPPQAKTSKGGGWRTTVSRFIKLMRVSLPDDYKLKIGLAVLACFVRTLVAHGGMLVVGRMVSAVLRRDRGEMARMTAARCETLGALGGPSSAPSSRGVSERRRGSVLRFSAVRFGGADAIATLFSSVPCRSRSLRPSTHW